MKVKEMDENISRIKLKDDWIFRQPRSKDGFNIHKLIESCPPLDKNSLYCNLLQASLFKQSCLVATFNEQIVGFVSAFFKSDKVDELFIWQIAVLPSMRGKGLAFLLLQNLLQQKKLTTIKAIETSITKSNEGSWRLFNKFNKSYGNKSSISILFDKYEHLNEKHETEYLYRILLSSHNNEVN